MEGASDPRSEGRIHHWRTAEGSDRGELASSSLVSRVIIIIVFPFSELVSCGLCLHPRSF